MASEFWREFARSRLSPSAFAEADKRQREYDNAMAGQPIRAPGPGLVRRWLDNRQANRDATWYWRVNGAPDPRQPSTVTRMVESARGRCSCQDPNCRYNQ